jgi:hypothetical protein
VVTALALALLTLATVALGVTGPGASYAEAAPRDPEQPLVLRMRSITPDFVPAKGPVIVRGTVTNASDQEWTEINVHGFIGDAPMTSTAELAAATHTPLTADVGSRITVPGTFDQIASLLPGETKTFKVRLTRAALGVSAPGVYWFGVHVLGNNGEGGDRVAVGRDRTFLSLVPRSPTTPQVDTALVLPVRAGVVRSSDGTIEDPDGWADSLRTGVLHDAVELGRAARGHSLSWLIDPAVADTVRALARGNPPRTLGTPRTPGDGGSPGPSPNPSASESGAAEGAGADAPDATQQVARRWLSQMHGLLVSNPGEILGLPYGDIAVDSAIRYDEPLLHRAMRRTGKNLRPWGLPLSSAVAPPEGRTTGPSLAGVPRGTDVLLDDTGVAGPAPTVNRVDGRRVVLIASAATQGGPGPVDPHSPLALRQRILGEAALRYLDDQQPLVVELPTGIDHRIPRSFFSGLDVPWMRLTTLSGATAVKAAPLSVDRLREPAAPQLGPRIYARANQLLQKSSVLQAVLPDNHVLQQQLFAETAGNTSYAASEDPFGALARVRSTDAWVADNLAGIDLTAPVSVTLASASGRFSALVSNDLDVPVSVKVKAASDARLRITGGETVQLSPHGRTTVLLNASTHALGVHTVTLQLTDKAGRPLGTSTQFPMRAEQVSVLIWVIIGAGVALLFAAIVVRLSRRVIAARAGREAL